MGTGSEARALLWSLRDAVIDRWRDASEDIALATPAVQLGVLYDGLIAGEISSDLLERIAPGDLSRQPRLAGCWPYSMCRYCCSRRP